MILTKVILLCLFLKNIAIIIDSNEVLTLFLDDNRTGTKLGQFFFFNSMIDAWGILAIFYFYYHPDSWKPVGKWELWMAVILGCINLIIVLYNIIRYVRKHLNVK